MQLGEGNLAATIERVLPLIAHVQIANPPGRNEPGVGEIHFPYLFDLLDRLRYAGWVGLEYRPSMDTLTSLAWARPFGIGAGARPVTPPIRETTPIFRRS
jgi:hydroxypyruvate isomerase